MNKVILVVEDEELQRLAVTKGLKAAGYVVFEAKDGKEGLEIALHHHPDVILTDIRMPNMDGMEMIHEIRGDEWGKEVPIVILSNFESQDGQIDQIMADHPAYYLMKVESSLEVIKEKIEELTK